MSPLPAKMDTVVVEKCQAFCQALITGNHKFTFSLSMGGDNFNFDNKELAKSSCDKKKKTPSQIRREEKRREKRKLQKTDATEKVAEKSGSRKCAVCDLCFNTEQGLKIHFGKAHKTTAVLSTPEKQRNDNTDVSLVLTPGNESRKEELDTSTEDQDNNQDCENYSCGGCGQIFLDEGDHSEHEDTVHPLMCHICHQFFEDKDTKFKHFVENCFKPRTGS